MQFDHDIHLAEPIKGEQLFRPYVEFKLIQLNRTPQCMTDGEIDFQINLLIEEAKKLGKKAKKKLKDAEARHDALLKK